MTDKVPSLYSPSDETLKVVVEHRRFSTTPLPAPP